MYKFKYSARRLKKLWIRAYKEHKEILIEIEVTTNKGSINWINNTYDDHDNFIDSLGIKEDTEVIQQAVEFAKELKQYKEIKSKYNL